MFATVALASACASVPATRPAAAEPNRTLSTASASVTRIAQAPRQEAPAADLGPRFGRPSIRLYGGSFDAPDPRGFANETSRASFGLGATWADRRRPAFALDLDLLWTKREFDALIDDSPAPPIPARADLSTIGLSGGGRVTLPVEGPVRFYGGLGLGLYWSELSARGVGGASGFSRSEDAFTPGAYLLGGVDVTLGNLLLGLNYRRWFVETDFDDFGLENVEVGGEFYGLVIGAVI
jgi:hypothetical protein